MLLLNVGCGANRPSSDEWVNIDNLYQLFPSSDMLERQQLDEEKNYLNHDLRTGLPFEDNTVDGILASHFMEHLDCCESLKFARECKRVLVPEGIFRISVPDPAIMVQFEKSGFDYWHQYKPDNLSFIEYALFFAEHKQLLTEQALYAILFTAGFSSYKVVFPNKSEIPQLASIDNRESFSLFVEGKK